jgi:hypothetical protein
VLVLLSFALVLVATVLLVLGLLNDDGLTLIYLSIASSVGAAIVLMAALRMNKPRAGEQQRVSAPDPIPVPVAAAAAGSSVFEPAPAEAATEVVKSEWLASEQDAWPDGETWDEGDEVEFPIAEYDTLTVGQILPLLPQLYADEIEVVEERERLTKARPQVLAKLADLRDATGAGADPLASYTEAAAAAGGWDDEEWFPIEEYESLSAAQILPLLPELDNEELTLVRTRELTLGRRRSLLDEIDRRLGVVKAPAGAAKKAVKAAPAKKTAPVSKPPAKKTPAKRAPAKPAPTAAAPVKKVAASKAPTSKAAPAKKAPAKAAPAKAASAKAAPDKAAPAKKAPAKAAAAKKAPTKAVSAKKTPTKAAPTTKTTRR